MPTRALAQPCLYRPRVHRPSHVYIVHACTGPAVSVSPTRAPAQPCLYRPRVHRPSRVCIVHACTDPVVCLCHVDCRTSVHTLDRNPLCSIHPAAGAVRAPVPPAVSPSTRWVLTSCRHKMLAAVSDSSQPIRNRPFAPPGHTTPPTMIVVSGSLHVVALDLTLLHKPHQLFL